MDKLLIIIVFRLATGGLQLAVIGGKCKDIDKDYIATSFVITNLSLKARWLDFDILEDTFSNF